MYSLDEYLVCLISWLFEQCLSEEEYADVPVDG